MSLLIKSLKCTPQNTKPINLWSLLLNLMNCLITLEICSEFLHWTPKSFQEYHKLIIFFKWMASFMRTILIKFIVYAVFNTCMNVHEPVHELVHEIAFLTTRYNFSHQKVM